MPSPTRDSHAASARGFIARLVDAYNPGITLLVLLWTAAFTLRQRLMRYDALNSVADDALKSLLLVIPIMLVGWGVLLMADRRFRLGLFRARDEG